MARLPIPGQDDGRWGQILNDYLSQSHNDDGTLKSGLVSKSDIGLANVDNTSDLDKPLSLAMQTALATKADLIDGKVEAEQLPTYVSSINGKSGDATLSANDVGADPAGTSYSKSTSDAKYSLGDTGPAWAFGAVGAFGPYDSSYFGSTRTVTLTGNANISAFNPGPSDKAGSIHFVIKQASSGGPYTLTWPTSIKWVNNTPAPVMPTVPNAELLVTAFWTGVSWRAMLNGIYYP